MNLKKGNYTLTMIKPSAVKQGFTGHILSHITDAGFKISTMKYVRLTYDQACEFYKVHKEKPFYESLCNFMSSGPIVAAIIEKENAIDSFREIIGNTDPKKAYKGTIRNLYGDSIESNAVHGSDSDDNAEIEANFFFSILERF